MKKFDRLPVESRKAEIQTAAKKLFLEKGFRAITMENIIANVTLSKGGVYRIYSSTTAILSDIIIEGMHNRNSFYQNRAQGLLAQNKPLDLVEIVDTICDGMLLLPEVAALYAELLIEKRHIPELEMLYQVICQETMKETHTLMELLNVPDEFMLDTDTLWKLSEVMNTTILGIVVLNHREDFEHYKKSFLSAFIAILESGDIYEEQ